MSAAATESSAIRAGLEDALAMGEVGVQVAAYLDGELLIDAWAGHADPGCVTPVGSETIFPILSAIKALTAIALHLQAERGLVDYDAPVARYWPDFAQAGKGAVSVAQVLCHRSGLPQLPRGVTLECICDWKWMVEATASSPPLLPPGSVNAYHALSWGWIIGEVVCRTDPHGRTFGEFVREEICEPLGITSLWIGLPDEESGRCADVCAESYPGPPAALAPLRREAIPPTLGSPQQFQNLAAFRRACIPAGNGIGNACSLARLYSMLAGEGRIGDVQLLSPRRVRWMMRPRPGALERDPVLGRPCPAGVGGLQLGRIGSVINDPVVGGGEHVLWHPGGGGTYAWADIDAGLAVAVCHNRMLPEAVVPGPDGVRRPFLALAEAIREMAHSRRRQRADCAHRQLRC